VIAALLASQHHALHMLLMLGIGGAGTSIMAMSPALRRSMLAFALTMAAITGYRLLRHPLPRRRRMINVLSIVITLGLVVWSLGQYGL
jgi:uncharacterized membrane protein